MKYNVKILKVLFFITILVFNSCAVENLDEHEHSGETGIKSRKLNLNEFEENSKASNLVKSLLENKITDSNALNRVIRDSVRNFTFDTNDGLFMQYVNLHSYTFPITRPVNNGKLENLVINLQNDGTYKVKLLIYNLTSQEQLELSQDKLKSIENPIIMIPIDNFDTTFVTEGCEEVTTIIYTSCSNGAHSFALDNVGDCSDWISGNASAPAIIVQTVVECTGSGNTIGGGSSSGGGGSWGGGGGPVGTYPPSFPSSSTPPEEYENGLTKPVSTTRDKGDPILNQPIKTPCDELKKMAQSNNVKTSLEFLENKTSGTVEFGFAVKKAANGDDPFDASTAIAQNPSNTSSLDINNYLNGEYIGLEHNHTNSLLTGGTPMFSGPDISSGLFQIAKSYTDTHSSETINYQEFFVTVAVRNEEQTPATQQTFAIKIKDWSKFSAVLNTFKKREKFNNQIFNMTAIKKERELENNPNAQDRTPAKIVDLQKGLLEIFRKLDLGIGLFESNENNDGWSEVNVDRNGQITKIPCN